MEENNFINKMDINPKIMKELFGGLDENARAIEDLTGVVMSQKDDFLQLSGAENDVKLTEKVISNLVDMIEQGEFVDRGRVNYVYNLIKEDSSENMNKILSDVIFVNFKGQPIRCKTAGQRKYVDSMRKNDVVFGIGPAGTGKTYLAMAMAVSAFKKKEIEKIILTRPAVEAGEKLGFLPGDLKMKVDPYLRPLYDALNDLMGYETYTKLIEREAIEIAPLAYMRGRTLNNAYIILDEAQNTTREQMKMILTRMGTNSKMVVNGDNTQLDLPDGKKSGLVDAAHVLRGIDGIGFVYLTAADVVRHELVMKIIKAYEKQSKG